MKKLLPVVLFFFVAIALLGAVILSGSNESPVVNFNTESGVVFDESPNGGAVGAAAASPAEQSGPEYGYNDYSNPGNGFAFDCCERDTPVIIAELPFPPLPPGYIDPDDDGFLPGSPLSPNGFWTISGRVTDPWGRGILGVLITATPLSNPNIWPLPTPFTTDTDGYYSVQFGPTWPPDVMTASTYAINFTGPRSGAYSWVNEWYNNVRDSSLATPVPLGSQGVDAVLMPTGIIRGRITNFSDNCFAAGLSSCVQIFAYRADRTEVVDGVRTGYMLDGVVGGYMGNAFTFLSLPPGDYKLLAQPNENIYDSQVTATKTYEKTWYGPANNWDTATVISVSPGSMADISITLESPDTSGNQNGPVYAPDHQADLKIEAESAPAETLASATEPAGAEPVSSTAPTPSDTGGSPGSALTPATA